MCANAQRVEQSKRVQPACAFEKGRWHASAHNDGAQYLREKRLAYDFVSETVLGIHGRARFHEEPVPDPIVPEQQPEVGRRSSQPEQLFALGQRPDEA